MNELRNESQAAIVLLTIDEDSNFPVDGRQLYERLELETPYHKWFARMCEYGFEEGKDYRTKKSVRSDGLPGRMREDHALTIDMAKHIAMVQRTEQAMIIRQYLIDFEREMNKPEKIMARALKIANKEIESLHNMVFKLETENKVMLPKAEYFDDLVDRALNTNFRTTAKEFGIKERRFIGLLEDHGYVYRDAYGKIQPYAGRNNGLFVVKECKYSYSDGAGTQTLITPKGRETFRLLVKKWQQMKE